MQWDRSEPITVLHVDDEPGLCDLVASFLEREHKWLSVETAPDAETALERLHAGDIDCVVSDYDMPGLDGLDFLRDVRMEHPDLPFILYTGKGSEEIASEAISAGVDDYLQKETHTEQYTVLANRIRNVVERRRAQSAAAAADRRYHNLVDTSPVPILLFDRDAVVVYANDAAVGFLDANTREALDDVRMPDLVDDVHREQALRRFETVFEADDSVPEVEFRIRTLKDRIKRAVVATAPGTYRGQRVAQAVAKRVEVIEDS